MEKLEIIVLGPGCANCLRLEKMCHEVLSEENIDARVLKVTDHDEIADYGILLTPGLIISGNVVLSGKMPTMSTLRNWIKTAAKE
jgi:small redox-active disulfide protein 2